jgi:phosphate transport system protein
VIGFRRRHEARHTTPGPGPGPGPEPEPETRTPAADADLDLREIDESVSAMFALVPERLAAATRAFLAGDREAAQRLVATDQKIDHLQTDIERLVQVELARQPLADTELRYLVTVLRIVPELERSADLVEHIALRTQYALTDPLTPQARGLIERMGAVAIEMWSDAAVAYRRRDPLAAADLRERDDVIDDLHVQLTTELAAADMSPSVAIELGLVARFFERLGDHAVNVTGRLGYVGTPAVATT